MTSNSIGIIDYGAGNLRSVANAIHALGGTPKVSSDPTDLTNCTRLILPGVGAFSHGMKALAENGLDHFLREASSAGTEIFGICLGMQMLASGSSEFGETQGLGILPGHIDQLCATSSETKLRLPNVGWAEIALLDSMPPLCQRVFAGTDLNARFYFIHSFAAEANNPATIATSTYSGLRFAAAIAGGNVIGTQFHPEKSGPAGLQLLRNFIS